MASCVASCCLVIYLASRVASCCLGIYLASCVASCCLVNYLASRVASCCLGIYLASCMVSCCLIVCLSGNFRPAARVVRLALKQPNKQTNQIQKQTRKRLKTSMYGRQRQLDLKEQGLAEAEEDRLHRLRVEGILPHSEDDKDGHDEVMSKAFGDTGAFDPSQVLRRASRSRRSLSSDILKVTDSLLMFCTTNVCVCVCVCGWVGGWVGAYLLLLLVRVLAYCNIICWINCEFVCACVSVCVCVCVCV